MDYIFIYYHSGSAQVDGSAQPPDGKKASPPHWHYVSCGLSDLHGDGRVHEYVFNMGVDVEGGVGVGWERSF